jgi:hypothetical protein
MRITRENLLRIARETVQQRSHDNRGLVAAYLSGSLLTENPFLGGATDIDLVFVHQDTPKVRREIIPLNNEIHIDIRHSAHSEYDRPRELRVHPWLGNEIYDPLLLYERQHFFEFIQAAVRDRFNEPVNVLARSRCYLENARQKWSGLQQNEEGSPELLLAYLQAVHHAANTVAILNGTPLAERRLLLDYPSRAETVGRPGLAAGLLGLLGGAQTDAAGLADTLTAWEADFVEAAGRPLTSARGRLRIEGGIVAARLGYYKLAFESLLASESPRVIIWPLVHTWTLAAALLPSGRQKAWRAFCAALGLSGESLPGRFEGLDHYLDDIDTLLDELAVANGL